MNSIAGSDGTLCARWRVIDLDLEWMSFGHTTLFFSYPTPLLTSMTLRRVNLPRQNFNSQVPFFPSVPSLHTVSIIDCEIPGIPDVSNAIFVQLAYLNWRGLEHGRRILSPLARAKQLQHLSLELWFKELRLYMADELSSLTFLHLGAGHIPDNIRDVNIPSLLELSLDFQIDNALTLLESKGIPFHRLQALVLGCDGYAQRYVSATINVKLQIRDICRDLLLACRHVERITCEPFMIGIVLKLLKDDCLDDGLLMKQTIRISDVHKSMDLGVDKEERLANIAAFCDDIGEQSIEEDWEAFLVKRRRF